MRFVFLFLTWLLLFSSCKQEKPRLELLEVKVLSDYPSGSASCFQKGHLVIMGDDAADLLLLDSVWKNVKRVNMFPFESKRIPKEIKADIEAATWFKDKNETGILMLGSGSTPTRNTGFIVQPLGNSKRSFGLDTFYNRLQQAGISPLNIEGLAQIPGWFVIACRGNMSFKKNHLVFVRNRFWEKQATVSFHVSRLGITIPGENFSGVSGLDYSYRTDRLFITSSTEHTGSAYEDGEIGKSYLSIVNSMNRMINYEAINPFEIIDLEGFDERFRGAKVESVSIISENKHQTQLALVADNDNGKTTVFKIALNHKKPD
ncbi:MAG: hypothetical protein EOO01_05945 [Chitinophagaceae bacterium]|nr:MAG: hypothetical protein EOO01_05945 [Chitinophagaceae bacterium]